jgi:archaemetzincin
MTSIRLVVVGARGAADGPHPSLVRELAPALARIFGSPCSVDAEPFAADFAFDPARGQYHSTCILERLGRLRRPPNDTRVLGVTPLDLFVPVLTFVFGEAQLDGRCALVSYHRLREEFYGLPPNDELLRARLLKESVHELGHTFGLRHCDYWECVMASSHAVERLDLKGAELCSACRARVLAPTPVAAS